jgi:hypothetical protein
MPRPHARAAYRHATYRLLGRTGRARREKVVMGDLIYVVLAVAFCALMLGYAVACEKL